MRRSDGRRRADSAAVTGGRGTSANSEELRVSGVKVTEQMSKGTRCTDWRRQYMMAGHTHNLTVICFLHATDRRR